MDSLQARMVLQAYSLGAKRGAYLSQYRVSEGLKSIFVPNPNDSNGITVYQGGHTEFGECHKGMKLCDFSALLNEASQF